MTLIVPAREVSASPRLKRIDLTHTDPARPPVPGEPPLAMDNIQGNSVVGFSKDFQTLLFLKITNVNAFKRWLNRKAIPQGRSAHLPVTSARSTRVTTPPARCPTRARSRPRHIESCGAGSPLGSSYPSSLSSMLARAGCISSHTRPRSSSSSSLF